MLVFSDSEALANKAFSFRLGGLVVSLNLSADTTAQGLNVAEASVGESIDTG